MMISADLIKELRASLDDALLMALSEAMTNMGIDVSLLLTQTEVTYEALRGGFLADVREKLVQAKLGDSGSFSFPDKAPELVNLLARVFPMFGLAQKFEVVSATDTGYDMKIEGCTYLKVREFLLNAHKGDSDYKPPCFANVIFSGIINAHTGKTCEFEAFEKSGSTCRTKIKLSD